jgi:hypothetical protein
MLPFLRRRRLDETGSCPFRQREWDGATARHSFGTRYLVGASLEMIVDLPYVFQVGITPARRRKMSFCNVLGLTPVYIRELSANDAPIAFLAHPTSKLSPFCLRSIDGLLFEPLVEQQRSRTIHDVPSLFRAAADEARDRFYLHNLQHWLPVELWRAETEAGPDPRRSYAMSRAAFETLRPSCRSTVDDSQVREPRAQAVLQERIVAIDGKLWVCADPARRPRWAYGSHREHRWLDIRFEDFDPEGFRDFSVERGRQGIGYLKGLGIRARMRWEIEIRDETVHRDDLVALGRCIAHTVNKELWPSFGREWQPKQAQALRVLIEACKPEALITAIYAAEIVQLTAELHDSLEPTPGTRAAQTVRSLRPRVIRARRDLEIWDRAAELRDQARDDGEALASIF